MTFAPSRAKVSATARPLPMPSPGLCPAPTTMAMRSFRRISVHSGNRVMLQYLFVVRLIVDFHGRQHTHYSAIEGDRENEVDHVFVGKMTFDLGKRRLGHCKLARHL